MALTADGTVATWGSGANGRLGNASFTSSGNAVAVYRDPPSSALFNKTVIAVCIGDGHCLALCSDGTIAGWGLNLGRLGNNSLAESSIPRAMSAASGVSALFGKTVVTVSGASTHSLAFCSDGTLAACGLNTNGQLGDGSMSQRLVPTAVSTASLGIGERFMVATSGQGSSHSVALVAGPPGIPQSTVEQPADTGLTDGSATPVNFGNVGPESSNSLIFKIANTGTSSLAALPADITFTGTNAADFSVTANPAASVAPAGSSAFTVRFTPGATGGADRRDAHRQLASSASAAGLRSRPLRRATLARSGRSSTSPRAGR